MWKSYKLGRVVTVDDPWGYGNSLEWATSCPPPRHNFVQLPRIRSERPAFDAKFPHLAPWATQVPTADKPAVRS
jgi:cytochrome c oxidase subunit 1